MAENAEKMIGDIRIAEEVIASIAGLAATEVKGVTSLAGGITHDQITRSGSKQLSRSVQVKTEGDGVRARVALVLDGTVPIPTVSKEASERVVSSLESMTGLTVTEVQITIAGVSV